MIRRIKKKYKAKVYAEIVRVFEARTLEEAVFLAKTMPLNVKDKVSFNEDELEVEEL